MLSQVDSAFIRAYMVARSARGVANRMAHLITPNEVLDKVRALRRMGFHLPLLPGAEAPAEPVALTVHPDADDDRYLDEDGRPAELSECNPLEGKFVCEWCERAVSSAWKMTTVAWEVDDDVIVSPVSFACTWCVAVVE